MSLEVHRVLLGILLYVTGGISVANIWSYQKMTYSRGVSYGAFLFVFRDGFVLPGLFFATAIAAWVAEIQPNAAALTTIGILLWFRRKEQQEWPGELVVSLGSYAPSAMCLVGVCLGRGLWRLGILPHSSDGWHISAGMLGFGWALMGINKIRQSGFRWMSSGTMALFVAERTTVGSAPARRVRRWLMNSPNALGLMGGLGLFGELFGLAFCFPELRWAYASFTMVFFLINWIILGFFEPEWALVMVVIAAAV